MTQPVNPRKSISRPVRAAKPAALEPGVSIGPLLWALLALLVALTLILGTANAQAGAPQSVDSRALAPQVGVMPDQFRLSGVEVESIRGVETISDWQTLDTRHLTLRINHAHQYLFKLADHCAQLRGARMVGVSMTNQEIWADFDYVAADGWECRIERITRLGRQHS